MIVRNVMIHIYSTLIHMYSYLSLCESHKTSTEIIDNKALGLLQNYSMKHYLNQDN